MGVLRRGGFGIWVFLVGVEYHLIMCMGRVAIVSCHRSSVIGQGFQWRTISFGWDGMGWALFFHDYVGLLFAFFIRICISVSHALVRRLHPLYTRVARVELF